MLWEERRDGEQCVLPPGDTPHNAPKQVCYLSVCSCVFEEMQMICKTGRRPDISRSLCVALCAWLRVYVWTCLCVCVCVLVTVCVSVCACLLRELTCFGRNGVMVNNAFYPQGTPPIMLQNRCVIPFSLYTSLSLSRQGPWK